MIQHSARAYALETQDELLKELQQTLNRVSLTTELPAKVFHFTDTPGTIGIVRNLSLRGTLFSALSDASEGKLGATRAIEIVGERLADKHYSGWGRKFDKTFQTLISDETTFNELGRIDFRACIVSFCARAAVSLHWSHYGRSGRGWALEFAAAGLEVGDVRLVRVRYQPTDQRQIVEALLNTARDFAERKTRLVAPSIADKLRTVYAHVAVSFIRMSSYLFKDAVFQYEDEWRLPFHILTETKEQEKPPDGYSTSIGYRSVDGRISPYADITYPREKFPLTSLVLGYACTSSEKDDSIRVLLEDSLGRERGKAIPITRSSVPVRP